MYVFRAGPGRAGCKDILLKILKLCLQNDAEEKININLNKLMEYWLTFDGKKSSAEDKSEKKNA